VEPKFRFTRIKETCIYVTDLHRTKEFYTDLLGLPVISLVADRHVFFRAGESVLLCFIAEKTLHLKDLPPHGATGCIHFAFEVEKNGYDYTLDYLKQKSIKILHEHTWPNKIRSFYFYDPDGNLVEVLEEGLWSDE
jgi:catechol 2,3-dioxygenase-like lactoylglutathione lyase family enzyme